MTEDQIAQLLVKHYEGTLSPGERRQLQDLSQRRPGIAAIMDRLDDKDQVEKDLEYYETANSAVQWPFFLDKLRRHGS